MSEKTQRETQWELDRILLRDDVIKTSDDRYAAKLVERIVFGALGVIGLAVLYALLKQINL